MKHKDQPAGNNISKLLRDWKPDHVMYAQIASFSLRMLKYYKALLTMLARVHS